MFKKITATALTVCSISIATADVINIYAHRGYRPIAPENTLPAYTEAMRIGVDVIDMDINMTKDKVLVVTHDLTLNPDLTKDENGNWITEKTPIKDLTLAQVKKYTVGYIKPDSATAKMYPNHIGMDNVHMPTLEEVINYVKSNVGSRVRLQIEIKTNPYDPEASWSAQEMAEALNKVLLKTGMTDNVEVQSFEWQALVDLQKLNPKVKTAYLTDHTTEPMNAEQAKQMANYQKWTAPLDPKDYNYNYPLMVKKLGGTFWEPFEKDLTKKDVDEAHKLGVKVVTWGWTEDEGSDFNYQVINNLIDWKVDGIITDRPDILRGVEAAKGLDLPPAYPNIPFPKKF
ncbi:glycerophosphodiester phosphodiesterase [Francisella tularensis subsp. novicida]|uniref:glycerophosphodiester phosphodiesterase n=1 Tax=Francisella tularensis TaxID=263 RepID=UPI0008FD7D72|nr:glycerophosphodiester phosphodiesterase [Francisella tularensis]APC95565.1 glycerophosphoryl diester phosphodiesterase family protein [Francisella tularensis subsp. novicida]MBK2346985.1 glycerophosphodiester phosphodiesterase [Francisella tularensis subsp. novicida]